MKEKLKKIRKQILTILPSTILAIMSGPNIRTLINSQIYKEEIQEYEKELEDYTKKFETAGKSDLEIIMEIQKDFNETILGYGEPKIDALGYLGMDVMDENGVGLCRNFAENIADKLNKINPTYNAREIALYEYSSNFIKNDIEQSTVMEDGTIIKSKNGKSEVYKNGKLLKGVTVVSVKEEPKATIGNALIGNHAIVAVDIESDNVTLLIDPTKLGLGIYKDGKIIMFNEQNQEEGIYDRKWLGEGNLRGLEGYFEYPIDYIKSFREPKLTMEELEKKYGLEAQNAILEKIEEQDKKQTFKDTIKISKTIRYNFNSNTAIMSTKEKER